MSNDPHFDELMARLEAGDEDAALNRTLERVLGRLRERLVRVPRKDGANVSPVM